MNILNIFVRYLKYVIEIKMFININDHIFSYLSYKKMFIFLINLIIKNTLNILFK